MSNPGIHDKMDRTEILRRVIADAESMGVRDKDRIEKLTGLVIERLERQRTLPGMEYLAPTKPKRQSRYQPSSDDITTIVKEILNNEASIKKEETHTEMDSSNFVTKGADKVSQKLTENALKVLEKRYLKKDKQGNLIETPEDMFRRVARTIAAADLI